MSRPIAEYAPTFGELTDYDRAHDALYLQMLDAAHERALSG